MKRVVSGALAGTVVAGAVVGLAAGLTPSSHNLGSGVDTTIAACDPDGVTTAYTYAAGGRVSDVVVSAIDDGGATAGAGACDGETVYVELLDETGALLTGATGSGTVTADLVATDPTNADDSVTVSIGTDPLAADVDQVRVTITGA